MNPTRHEPCPERADGGRRARPQARLRLMDETLTEGGQ
jgi:hypothetical protein